MATPGSAASVRLKMPEKEYRYSALRPPPALTRTGVERLNEVWKRVTAQEVTGKCMYGQ